jgi:hypothetical protein
VSNVSINQRDRACDGLIGVQKSSDQGRFDLKDADIAR